MSYVSVKGLGDAVAACPDGTHQVCMIAPPGEPSTPDMCSCRPNTLHTTTASMASATNHHWGLIAGLALAAVVVYKVASH